MYTTIKNKYGEAESYAKPVVSKPIQKDVFMGYIRESVEKMYARSNVTRNNYRIRANILGQYLDKYGINEVNPDEQFIKVMWDRLKENGEFETKTYKWETRKKVPRFTREVINGFLYSKGLVQRQVLKDMVSQRYVKFLGLTRKSQEAVKWFEQNGKQVEVISVYVGNPDDMSNPVLHRRLHVTERALKPITKSGKIEHALRFLKAVDKNGFEFITDDDVKEYEAICLQRGVKQKEDYLAHIATFFINIYSEKFIKTNPLSHVSLKMSGGAVKKDFITVEGMEKIKDLTTLDRSNRFDVRDRLFALLGYDLAIRIGEVLSLKISDFKKDDRGEWFLLLDAEIQKGHKEQEVMYLHFDETRDLLDLYLNKIREQFVPTTDFLILSNQRGKGLSDGPCATQFKKLCKRLGIKTYYGNNPSPHVLRHTFATLNIEPIGLKIGVGEMAERLRHSRVETTRKHYIHNNPYLKRMKHDAIRKNNRKKTAADILNEMPLANHVNWLSDLGADSAMIKQFKNLYKSSVEPKDSQVDKKEVDNRMFISEKEALERLQELKISVLALRNYAIEKSATSKEHVGTTRYGTGFKYREDFIDDLVRNWALAETYRKNRKMNKTVFYRRLKSEKWRNVRLGKLLYINRQDCF